MNNIIMLDKENPQIPDNWGVEITYYDGTKETFDVVAHSNSNGVFNFVTKDNEHKWRVLDKIKAIDFDKRFSKFIDLQKEAKK